MSSIISKNKNTFNKLIKELKRKAKTNLDETFYKTFKFNGELYYYSFRVGLDMEFGDFELVQVGSKVYICTKLISCINSTNATGVLSNALNFILDYSENYTIKGNSIEGRYVNSKVEEILKNLQRDGVAFNGKRMREVDAIQTKAYKNLENAINEIILSGKFEYELINNVYKGFPRRDLFPLAVYYSNTDELSYVSYYKWASNPENMGERSREWLNNLIKNNSIDYICDRIVRYTPFRQWVTLKCPDSITSNLKEY